MGDKARAKTSAIAVRRGKRGKAGEQGGEARESGVIPHSESYPTGIPQSHSKIYQNTHAWVEPFLAALSLYPNITRAAQAAGVTVAHVQATKRHDPLFAESVARAYEAGAALLKDTAVDRVLEGIERTVTRRNGDVERYVEYPERLHIELLRATHPEFRQAAQQGAGGPVTYRLEVSFRQPGQAPALPAAGVPGVVEGEILDGDSTQQDGGE